MGEPSDTPLKLNFYRMALREFRQAAIASRAELLAFALLTVLALLMIARGSGFELHANGPSLDAAGEETCTLVYRFQVQFSGDLVRILLGQQDPETDCPEVSLRSGNGGTGQADAAYPFALTASGTVTIPWNSPAAGSPDRIIGGLFNWKAKNRSYTTNAPAPSGNQVWEFSLLGSDGNLVSLVTASCLPGGACGPFYWTLGVFTPADSKLLDIGQ